MAISIEDDFRNEKESGDFSQPGSDDETFHLENLDEYPGDIPEFSGSPENSKKGSDTEENFEEDATVQTGKENIENEISETNLPDKSNKMKKLFIYSTALALLIMFAAMTYDWGVNRGGFSDVAKIIEDTDIPLAKQHPETDQPGTVKKELLPEPELYEEDEAYRDEEAAPTEPYGRVEIIVEESDVEYYDPEPVKQPSKRDKPKYSTVQKDDSFIEDGGYTKRKTVQEKKKIKKPEVKKKYEQQSDFADNVTSRLKKSSVQEENRLYTVQVYASPSKEDAESWKKKLESKDIGNVFISTQKIRDRQWYRVRFGSFKSEKEARKAALKLGFAQSWIDRVR